MNGFVLDHFNFESAVHGFGIFPGLRLQGCIASVSCLLSLYAYNKSSEFFPQFHGLLLGAACFFFSKKVSVMKHYYSRHFSVDGGIHKVRKFRQQ